MLLLLLLPWSRSNLTLLMSRAQALSEAGINHTWVSEKADLVNLAKENKVKPHKHAVVDRLLTLLPLLHGRSPLLAPKSPLVVMEIEVDRASEEEAVAISAGSK